MALSSRIYWMNTYSFRLKQAVRDILPDPRVVQQQAFGDAPLGGDGGQIGGDARALGVGRPAGQRLHEHVIEATVDRARLPFREPLPPLGGLADHERAVEQGQRLRRHVGRIPLPTGRRRLRQVEHLEERIVGVAPNLLVDAAAAVAVHRTVVRIPFGQPMPRRVVHRHRRPVHRRVEPAGDRQHRIADRLRVQAPEVGVLQPAVGRVALERLGRRLAAHAVGLAQHQPADHALERVPVGDERRRQVVQQVRMGGRVAEPAEIVDRAHQAVPEQMPPDAVDRHPRRQRVVVGRDRVGQPHAHLAGVGIGLVVERGQEPAGHDIPEVLVAPPHQEGLVGRRFFDHTGRPARHRHRPLEQPVSGGRTAQRNEVLERARQEVGPHELVEERRLLRRQGAVAPGRHDVLQPGADERRQIVARGGRLGRQQLEQRHDGVAGGRLFIVKPHLADADRRTAVTAPRRPVGPAAVLGVEGELRDVVLRRELDIRGEPLPERRVPLRPRHLVLLRTVAQVIDAAARHRVVLDDQDREAQIAAEHAQADEVVVNREARGLDDAGMLVRQQMRVGAAWIDAVQQPVARAPDGELARRRRRRGPPGARCPTVRA